MTGTTAPLDPILNRTLIPRLFMRVETVSNSVMLQQTLNMKVVIALYKHKSRGSRVLFFYDRLFALMCHSFS
jgi:hypothetical protein